MKSISFREFTYQRENQWMTLSIDVSSLLGRDQTLTTTLGSVCVEVVGRHHRVQYSIVEVRHQPGVDGDVLCWMLAPTPDEVIRVPASAATRIAVYNT